MFKIQVIILLHLDQLIKVLMKIKKFKRSVQLKIKDRKISFKLKFKLNNFNKSKKNYKNRIIRNLKRNNYQRLEKNKLVYKLRAKLSANKKNLKKVT